MGRGIWLGHVDGFPTCLIDLTQLPIASEVLPLLLVAKGPQERALVTFLVDHFEAYPQHLRWLKELHVQQLWEVLAMKKLTAEQIGLDYEALLDLIGEERALGLIGEEWALDLIDKDRVLDNLLRRQGEQWLREQLERRTQPPDAKHED